MSVSRLTAALCGLLLAFAPAALAAPTPVVDLGQASSYAVLSGASVGNTVSAPGAPHTTLRGDLGVKADAQPTGFPPGVVTGVTRIGTPAAAAAHDDLVAAYTEVAGRTGGAALAGALAGATVGPGLHKIAGAASNTTTLTLDAGGNPDAVFVFQVDGALSFAAGSHVVLAGGARASRVFWQVNGAGAVGANADFAGTLMALNAVAVGSGTIFNGRAMARNGALTLDNNQFYSGPPALTIDGGAADITTDTTPTISGTTDVEAPGVVTVRVAGQTLSAAPAGGVWSVTASILANGTYPIVASTVDGAANEASATQQLTVDTVLPVVSIDGGPAALTDDDTPTIAGTTDVAPGTTVDVTIDFQHLTALVQANQTWNVTPAALGDGTHTVAAAVEDPAGNAGTDEQALTVDTSAPAAAIDGGAEALTNDATPTIAGTAAVPAGTTVAVTLADETLAGAVQTDGSWSVTASALSDGPHRVVLSVSDPAGNAAAATQVLTVDTVSPAVSIVGGATATTSDTTPTITGTSDAAPGTTVTVAIAGQTMTTLLQSDGGWNTTPSAVGDGVWDVVATVPDPAGNVGRAAQALTIGAVAPSPSPTPSPSPSPSPGPSPSPSPAPSPEPTATPAPAPDPVVLVTPPAAGEATLTGQTLTTGLLLRCAAAAGCEGSMRVFADKTAKRKRLLIGTFRYDVEPGASARVVLRLNPRGRRLLKRTRKLKATLVATSVDAAGARTTTTSRTTLRIKPARR